MSRAEELERDLEILARQEAEIQFPTFDADRAWSLGGLLRELAARDRRPVAMGIWMAGQSLFYSATNGVVPSNEGWLLRKRNTVLRFGRSSYRVGLQMEKDGTTLEARQGLVLAEYAAHGGGFPLILRGSGCVGAIVVSGLTQREDHELVIEAAAGSLGIEASRLP